MEAPLTSDVMRSFRWTYYHDHEHRSRTHLTPLQEDALPDPYIYSPIGCSRSSPMSFGCPGWTAVGISLTSHLPCELSLHVSA